MGAAIVADGTHDAAPMSSPREWRPSRTETDTKETDMARPKIYPCLWFDGTAVEAAEFYISLIPDSRIDKIWKSPAETPSGPEGMDLLVDFTVAGQQLQGLNGGDDFSFNEAVSLVIECDNQAEIDRLWGALTADGGEPGPCGWLKDRYGLSWQITPKALNDMLDSPDRDAARRSMQAMLAMGKLDVAELQRAFDGAEIPAPA
jgi:predicted 3-demethylubiquinone-9 3-methyltransferase (glyoxalase superfamily)